MTMDGKRFGAGLAGGLLMALVIVGASGLAGSSLSGSFSSGGGARLINVSATTSTTTVASVTSSPSTASSGTYTATTGTVLQPPGSNVSAMTTTATGTSTVNSSIPQGFGVELGQSTKSPSSLASIATQPATSTVFVIVPVLVALFLGAVIYRASRGGRTEEQRED